MVENIQSNSLESLPGMESKILGEIADLTGGESKFVGNGNDDYSNLGTVIAAAVGGEKLGSAVDLVTGDKKDSKYIKKTPAKDISSTIRVDLMSKSGYRQKLNLVNKNLKAALPTLKNIRSKFINHDLIAKLGISNMALGPNAHKSKGVKMTKKAVEILFKNLRKLKEQLAQVRRMQINPYLNSNGSINTTKLTDHLADGKNQAETFYNGVMNHNSVQSDQIYRGMGGPPKVPS